MTHWDAFVSHKSFMYFLHPTCVSFACSGSYRDENSSKSAFTSEANIWRKNSKESRCWFGPRALLENITWTAMIFCSEWPIRARIVRFTWITETVLINFSIILVTDGVFAILFLPNIEHIMTGSNQTCTILITNSNNKDALLYPLVPLSAIFKN